MITILHGDNEPQMHAELVKQMTTAREKSVDVIRLDAKKIEISNLETAIGTDALFSSEKLIVIDGLFSLPRSKRKDALTLCLQDRDAPEITLILTEKKTLTATQLKSFPSAKVTVFKYPAILFQWLETIGTIPPARALEVFHHVLYREDSDLAFIMLFRQVPTLLSFVSNVP